MKAKWKSGQTVSFHYMLYPEKRYIGRLVRPMKSGVWKIDTDDKAIPTTFAHEDTFRKVKKSQKTDASRTGFMPMVRK